MDINKTIASELKLNLDNVNAAVTLLDEGNTVPFIARYRKEVTGGSWVDCVMAVMKKRISI